MHIIQSSVLGLVSVNVSNILVPSTPYFSSPVAILLVLLVVVV